MWGHSILGALNLQYNVFEGTKSVKLPIVDCSFDPCNNGGSCIDVDNNFICSCQSGWYGKNCDKEIIMCSSNPCSENGECEDKENGFFCKCNSGFRGICYHILRMRTALSSFQTVLKAVIRQLSNSHFLHSPWEYAFDA